jgi:hypothetical protein
MLIGDRGREDGTRRAVGRSRGRARSDGMDERRAAALERSSERWLAWLRRDLAGRRPGEALAGLWDLLDEWFSSDDFHASGLAAAMAGMTGNGGDATRRAVAAHRRALRQLLEDLAAADGAADPAGLATQLHLLVEGAVVGALIDRHPAVTRHARELTQIALGGRTRWP